MLSFIDQKMKTAEKTALSHSYGIFYRNVVCIDWSSFYLMEIMQNVAFDL